MLRQHVYKEILILDEIIQNITITEAKVLKYKDLCAKNNKKCFENYILLLENKTEMTKKLNYSIKYPLNKEGMYDFRLNSLFLGGVEVDENKFVKTAKAMSLYYYLNDGSTYEETNAKQWLKLFLRTMASTTFQYITVDRYTSITFDEEIIKVVYRAFPRMPMAIAAAIIFSILTCLYNNWIESKPWIGAIALMSGGLSLASSFGLLMYLNVPFVASAATVPFLILGISMDDAFVFLAAWRRTDNKNSVADRLGEVYSESAISVTITSLTNFVAFISGIFTPYNIVKYFCFYASTAVIFCYVYQLTFIGACMAICGYLEKQNRHSLFFVKLENSNDNENQSWIRKYFFSNRPWKSQNNSSLIVFTQLGNVLSLRLVKVFVFFILFLHMAVGFWGITKIDVIGEYSEIATSDSYFLKYLENNYKYFSLYKYRFQIVIDEEIDYADLKIQRQIEEMFIEMKNKNLIADSLTESWLRTYLEFLNDERMSSIIEAYNMSNSNDFIKVLRQIFLRHPATKHFRNDITFNKNYTAIIGSRFLCQSHVTEDIDSDFITLFTMREITDNTPFSAFPYIYYSYWADEIELHVKFTIQMLCSIAVIVIFICFIFMPDIITTFSVTFSVISTEICTLGYMSLWNVYLAPVSIIILVMCAGFSVDYSAHLSHTYRECKSNDHNERLRKSINWIGLAIFQGSVTTIISILPLAYPLAYIFVASFKILFLVILFSAINALIFLPVILVTLKIVKQLMCSKKEKITVNIKEINGKNSENINLGFHYCEKY